MEDLTRQGDRGSSGRVQERGLAQDFFDVCEEPISKFCLLVSRKSNPELIRHVPLQACTFLHTTARDAEAMTVRVREDVLAEAAVLPVPRFAVDLFTAIFIKPN